MPFGRVPRNLHGHEKHQPESDEDSIPHCLSDCQRHAALKLYELAVRKWLAGKSDYGTHFPKYWDGGRAWEIDTIEANSTEKRHEHEKIPFGGDGCPVLRSGTTRRVT